jgi:oligopeptide/dipeptide ABC transporter ATP-binding protein
VKEQRLGLLLITHDLATARLLCDRVIVLFGGRIVEDGPAEQILLSPSHPYTRQLLGAIPRGDPRPVLASTGRLPVPASGEGCHFRSRCTEATTTCRGSMPQLTSFPDGRRVRCFNRESAHAV